MAKSKGGAPFGNKNAKGAGKIALANVGGLISGLMHKPKYNEKALETYKKYGAGTTGYQVGKISRKIATLGLERK